MTDNEIEFYDIPNFNGSKINKKGQIYSDKSILITLSASA